MSVLIYAVLLLPLGAALVIGIGLLGGWLRPLSGERFTVAIAQGTVTLAALLALLLLDGGTRQHSLALPWLQSGDLVLQLSFVSGGMHGVLCVLFALLSVVVLRFAAPYMHRDAGFHRFFCFMCVLVFAMLLLVSSGSALLSFVAWELAGISSWCLIAYNYRRAQAAANATRVFIVQRGGDAAFLLGLTLLLLWTGSGNWYDLPANVAQLSDMQATVLALAFASAACVKSAQVPVTPWLLRAMEGPTPSSTLFYGAVMMHAGVFLVILLAPLFERSTVAMAVLFGVGMMSALFGWIVGRGQSDVKGSLACATVSQLGLMFAACGLGWWQLAFWHLCAHAVLRCYLFLRSPAMLHHGHDLPLAPRQAPAPWLRAAALQQLWLDAALDWALVRPARRLAQDLAYFEAQALDPLMGTPAPLVRRMSALLQQEETRIGARLDNTHDNFAQGSGLAGKLTEWVAALSNWFEQRFILQGLGRDMISFGRHMGQAANRFEHLLLRPRYLVAFVLLTLLVAV
jgi:NADH:ubiquinone oxidoreductase subunit 5 (subunit L)/multisubunit Na+/H+ antiporter MnhA subunit